ncbi:Ribosomal protein L1p/L10e-like protein [Elsinoe fawcettii]|nr:Ribosomal protein L1p/L10e-like protein [Elsinoe fawcettii]
MAPAATEVAVASSPRKYALDPSQTLRAATALLTKMQSDLTSRTNTANGKASLLSDSETATADPIWLLLTTKKHITDRPRLKPGKISLPHPLPIPLDPSGAPEQKICLITVDPQRYYKDLIAHPSFPQDLAPRIRVLGITKLKSRYKAFEARRQLFGEYDVFLADDRVVTYLPKLLGKVFYATGAKRPVPVNLQGKRLEHDIKGEKRVALAKGGNKSVRAAPGPETVGREIERALGSALVHLSPGTNVSVKIGTIGMQSDEVKANIEKVVEGLVETYVPKGWRNVKGVHIKGPKTTSLPIWLAEEMWVDEEDVLNEQPKQLTKDERKAIKVSKRKSRAAFDDEEGDAVEETATKRRKGVQLTEDRRKDTAERSAKRKQQMAELKADVRQQVSV